MSNKDLVKKYRVVMEQIPDPGEDIQDVRKIELDIYAVKFEDAVTKAWKTVTVTPDLYEIILIESMNRPYYRNTERF